MNIGDRLYCYYNDGDIDITIGKYYCIDDIYDDGKHWFMDDYDNWDWVRETGSQDRWYYGKWFYTKQEVRKLKLNKLLSL